jgi:hypothetical protein
LGVKSTVDRVFILLTADRTQGEGSHGRLVTIIGNVFDDGESRSTVSAVNEGIAVPEVDGREQLGEARVTGSHIRRDQGKAL